MIAPTQQPYIPVHTIATDRKCAWFPFCTKLAQECGGTIKTKCEDKINFINITTDMLTKAKTRIRNKKRAERTQKKRKELKNSASL